MLARVQYDGAFSKTVTVRDVNWPTFLKSLKNCLYALTQGIDPKRTQSDMPTVTLVKYVYPSTIYSNENLETI